MDSQHKGRSLDPELRKLEFVHILHIVVLILNFIGGKNGIFIAI